MTGPASRPGALMSPGHLGQCHLHSPLSQRELYWSVLMAVCLPMVRKMAASVPMKSMYTPA